jgi:hypothetical protein
VTGISRGIVRATPDGKLLVQGKEVTGFTNGEEEEVGLTKILPFLVEDEMLKLGATFSKKANWAPHVVSDGLLITGQNPHSSGSAAKALMAAVKQKAKPAASEAIEPRDDSNPHLKLIGKWLKTGAMRRSGFVDRISIERLLIFY